MSFAWYIFSLGVSSSISCCQTARKGLCLFWQKGSTVQCLPWLVLNQKTCLYSIRYAVCAGIQSHLLRRYSVHIVLPRLVTCHVTYNFQQIQAKPYAIKMAESDWGDFEFDDSGPTPIPRPSSKIHEDREMQSSLLLPAKRMNLTHHRSWSARVWPSKLHEYSHLPATNPTPKSTPTILPTTLCQRHCCSFRPVHREIGADICGCQSNTTTNCTSPAHGRLEPPRRPVLHVYSTWSSKPARPLKHLDPP